MSSEQLWAERLIPVSVPAQKVQSEPPSRRYGEDCGQRRAALSLSLVLSVGCSSCRGLPVFSVEENRGVR